MPVRVLSIVSLLAAVAASAPAGAVTVGADIDGLAEPCRTELCDPAAVHSAGDPAGLLAAATRQAAAGVIAPGSPLELATRADGIGPPPPDERLRGQYPGDLAIDWTWGRSGDGWRPATREPAEAAGRRGEGGTGDVFLASIPLPPALLMLLSSLAAITFLSARGRRA